MTSQVCFSLLFFVVCPVRLAKRKSLCVPLLMYLEVGLASASEVLECPVSHISDIRYICAIIVSTFSLLSPEMQRF